MTRKQRVMTAPELRGLVWRAYETAWNSYLEIHEEWPIACPLGSAYEREYVNALALAYLRGYLLTLADQLDEVS